MAEDIRSVMTREPVCLDASTSLTEAARTMDDRDIGDVLVMENGELCGIVTDRDIAIRGVARGEDPDALKLGGICSRDVVCLSPDQSVEDAIERMRDRAIRRIPVVEDGKPVGIVSLGDLAEDRDRESVLGAISAAPSNN